VRGLRAVFFPLRLPSLPRNLPTKPAERKGMLPQRSAEKSIASLVLQLCWCKACENLAPRIVTNENFPTSTGASQSPILTRSVSVGGECMSLSLFHVTQTSHRPNFQPAPLLEIENASTYVETMNPPGPGWVADLCYLLHLV
jgi:hypothetical protein